MGVQRQAGTSTGMVTHNVSSDAVLKVLCGDEVLRLRTTHPLSYSEVRRLVDSALNLDDRDSRSNASASQWSPLLWYMVEGGVLTELNNNNFQEFLNSYGSKARTFRVYVQGERPASFAMGSADPTTASTQHVARPANNIGDHVASFLTTSQSLLPPQLPDALRGIKRRAGEAVQSMASAGERSRELRETMRASAELQKAIEASSAESRSRLAKVLDLYKARIRPVAADGNCQFRALSTQLYGEEEHHAALRARVVAQLRARRERYENYVVMQGGSYDEYVDRMSRDGEWGDNVTLQAACDALDCVIHVLTDQPGSQCLELSPTAEDPSAGSDSASTMAQKAAAASPGLDSSASTAEASVAQPRQKPLCLTFLTEVHYDAFEVDG